MIQEDYTFEVLFLIPPTFPLSDKESAIFQLMLDYLDAATDSFTMFCRYE